MTWGDLLLTWLLVMRASQFNMIHPQAASTEHGRLTIRTVVLIDPEKRVQLLMHYPAGTGRNFQEILRCIDSLTVTLEHKVRCWQTHFCLFACFPRLVLSRVIVLAGRHTRELGEGRGCGHSADGG